MTPAWAARVITVQLLGRDPNATELKWVEMVIRSVLPSDPDATPTRPHTLKDFPAPHGGHGSDPRAR
jgi:hypothetical protein